MKCGCGGRTAVLDSRPTDDGAGVRRRRRCVDCGARWATLEFEEGTDRPERLDALAARLVAVLAEFQIVELPEREQDSLGGSAPDETP